MLAPGQIVDIDVQSVEDYGLYGTVDGHNVLVPIPETSWIASYCSCRQFAVVGDRFRTQVLHVDGASGNAAASIRALYPDPWRGGLLKPGAEHQARVVRIVASADRCDNGPGWLLELLPGGYVMLCGSKSLLEVGASCLVTVVAVDVSKRAVGVALKQG